MSLKYSSTNILNILHQSKSLLRAHKKIKQSLVELLMGPLGDHLSRRGLQFVAAGSFMKYHSTYSEVTSNDEEAGTLLIHCITSSKLHGKCGWVYASDVDVAMLLIAYRNLLGCKMLTFESVLKILTLKIFLSFLVVNAQNVF